MSNNVNLSRLSQAKYSKFLNRISIIKQKRLIREYQEINPSEKGFPWINIDGIECIQFSTCNYLGLSSNKTIITSSKKILDNYGSGTGGSRYIGGTHKLHNLLEKQISKFHGKEKCVLYNTGYTANLGAISCLVQKEDIIFSDEQNHASIIDGIRLSKANKVIWKHNDLNDLEEKLKAHPSDNNKFIICESLYSMDGDFAPIEGLVKLAKQYNCLLYVDEIHAIGVYGNNGSGVCSQLGIASDIDFIMGGTSKGLGSLGGYICLADPLDVLLKNRSNAFIFTISLPDVILNASLEALKICTTTDHLRNKIKENSNYFRNKLLENNFNFLDSKSHIFPIMVGSSQDTHHLTNMLKEKGIYAQGVCFPSVAEGLGRIRISITASHEEQHMDYLLSTLQEIRKINKIKFLS